MVLLVDALAEVLAVSQDGSVVPEHVGLSSLAADDVPATAVVPAVAAHSTAVEPLTSVAAREPKGALPGLAIDAHAAGQLGL